MAIAFNGRPFNPDEFGDALMKAAVEQVKEQLHERISAIRHPTTGEFPVVHMTGTKLDKISAQIEASPELLESIRTHLSDEELSMTNLVAMKEQDRHKAFLSYAWENRDLAKQIAEALQANGIDVWWAEWEIRAGDSLRQKIDEGLLNCTDFIVLLTPESIHKSWVNQEMDAGLVRKIESQARFIAIRNNLPVSALPPLLKGMLSPALEDFENDIRNLINDILGVTRKPALGAPPAAARAIPSGYSPAATAVAGVFVEATTNAVFADPPVTADTLCERTQLSPEDVSDALHELGEMVEDNFGTIYPHPELFVTFDQHFKAWNPAADALTIAADLQNDPAFPREPQQIANRYGWPPRRLNPALAYLVNRKLIASIAVLAMHPWVAVHLERTDATRR